jgi:broad specificity phosphatase PhoE
MTHLILVRHGESHLNAQHRISPVFCGQIETDLTPVGIAQAQAVGRYLAHHPSVRITLAISSTLRRAADTLQGIVSQQKHDVHILPSSAGINERSLGEFEGLSEEEVFAKWPEYRDDDSLNRFRNDFLQKAPGGENLTEVTNRAWPVVEAIMQDGGDLLVVSHYNPTRCILGRALKLPPEEILALRPKNACPYVLRYDGGRYELVEEVDVDVV